MLIFDRTQWNWAKYSVAVLVAATGLYCWSWTWLPNGPTGGSLPGLFFGFVATALMIYAGFLGARRRWFGTERWGSASFWLRSHLWIGTLTVPFALFHANFGFGGWLERGLWLLFFAVVLSGFWGLALQNILPRMMLENISRETFIQQIPFLCAQFTVQSDAGVASKCGNLDIVLQPFELATFDKHLRPLFEEIRKADRITYPTNKGESEATQFQRFLGKIYHLAAESVDKPSEVQVPKAGTDSQFGTSSEVAGASSHRPRTESSTSVPAVNELQRNDSGSTENTGGAGSNSVQTSRLPEQAKPSISDEAPKTTPVASIPVFSVARTTGPAVVAPENQLDSQSASQHSNPIGEASSSAVPQTAAMAPAKPKPDLAAMRAAALAKKESQSATIPAIDTGVSVPAISPSETTGVVLPPAQPTAKPKPDLAAMRAAALAKKEVQTASAPVKETVESAPTPPVVEATPEVAAAAVPPATKPKPDLAAMRAATLAKKDALSETSPTKDASESPPVAISAEAVAETAHDQPVARPSKPKPDLTAMRAAALAKKELASTTPVVTATGESASVKPKPDLAAMRAAAARSALSKDPATTNPEATPQKPTLAPVAQQSVAVQVQTVRTPAPSKPATSASSQASAKPSADQLADFKKFYQDLIRPFLGLQRRTPAWREGISRAILATRVRAKGEHPVLAPVLLQLQDYCEQRQQFALIQSYQNWLHGWLFIHIPFTVALYCILIVHIITALGVIPFGN